MRKVFIDCGYYKGSAIKLFKETKEYDDNFEYIAFEANKKIFDSWCNGKKNTEIKLHNCAVWIENGEIDFIKSTRRRGKANSVFPNKKAAQETMEKVPSIDFSQWIINNFSKNDFIIVKMDIEGAEFFVLEKMIKDKSIEYINILYIEYHMCRFKRNKKIDPKTLNDIINKKEYIDKYLNEYKSLDVRNSFQ